MASRRLPVLRLNSAGGQMVDLSALIWTQSKLDDHRPAPLTQEAAADQSESGRALELANAFLVLARHPGVAPRHRPPPGAPTGAAFPTSCRTCWQSSRSRPTPRGALPGAPSPSAPRALVALVGTCWGVSSPHPLKEWSLQDRPPDLTTARVRADHRASFTDRPALWRAHAGSCSRTLAPPGSRSPPTRPPARSFQSSHTEVPMMATVVEVRAAETRPPELC